MIGNLDDALEALLAFPGRRDPHHVSLDVMAETMELLGQPQDKLRLIHVGGTSAKTSTAYLIRAGLEAAGFKTGLTVSPHVATVNERVQIGGRPLEPAKFCAYVDALLARLKQMRRPVTYFELVTSLALWVFACEKVDYAVVEVGLGGTRDATNIARRPDKVSVIGPIGLDHTEKLGSTLAEIAAQKAGIIVPGGAVFVADQAPAALDVITAHGRQLGAAVTVVPSPAAPDGSDVPDFQWRNWGLASAVLDYLGQRDGFAATRPAGAELTGFLQANTPPGRYEWLTVGSRQVLLDGAHNPQKMAGLVETMRRRGVPALPTLATLSSAPVDKVRQTLAELAPAVSRLIVPDFALGRADKVKRSVPAEQVGAVARQLGLDVTVVPNLAAAVETWLAGAEPELLVTGSLYLVALVRPGLLALGREAASG